MKTKELNKEEKEKLHWFLECNMEELLQKSVEENWRQSELDAWIKVKMAQFLEKIAYSK